MDLAAYNGHLDTIEWLYANRTEGCTTQAMDLAASNGHLEIVKWLHENHYEGCTADAMRFAAANEHFEVLLFLRANRHEGCSPNPIGESEECIQNMEITQWLHEHYPDSVNVDRLASRGGGLRK